MSVFRQAESQLLADADDLYHTQFKKYVVPVLLIYVLHALWASYKTLRRPEEDGDGPMMSVGGDSGLEMDLKEPFPRWMLAAHAVGACVLVVLTIIQKEVVGWMADIVKAKAESYRGASAELLKVLRSPEYATGLLRLHRRLGYAILACLAVMDGAGYKLGSEYSAFPGFATFAKFFAAPFALWLVGIWATAKLGWLQVHRLLANMLLKGCIATPLSRIGGAILQRSGWSTADGYYKGIGGVAAIIAVWQTYELALFARDSFVAMRGASPSRVKSS
jgi:hypothetical protein